MRCSRKPESWVPSSNARLLVRSSTKTRSEPAARLESTGQAAADAATNILDADLSEAQQARVEAREALQEALEMATAQVDQASEAPVGEPDLAAQERVGEFLLLE